ncbi:MAG TPA: ATP-dependent DNA helicase, partial [Methanomassiliicoccales archaeon]|nr:ATP-dependent DNA helicase [Methanomassiliicoccales archaeon]
EMRRINKHKRVTALAMQGRRSTCLQQFPEEKQGPGELARVCEEMKKRSRSKRKGGCHFYENCLQYGEERFRKYASENVPTAEEFIKWCESLGACPREAMRAVIPEAKVVVAPYNYILSKEVRQPLLEQWQVEEGDLIVIVDEAHNLPDSAREEECVGIFASLLTSVREERKHHGNILLGPEVHMDRFIECMFDTLEELGRKPLAVGKNEGEIAKGELMTVLGRRLELDEDCVRGVLANLSTHGQGILDKQIEQGNEAVSNTLKLAERLERWMTIDEGRFIFQVRTGEQASLEALCLEPMASVEIFRSCHASVHMSGTLRPLGQYTNVLGLGSNCVRRTFESPFPKENRTIFYVDDVNASYDSMSKDPGNARRMLEHIVSLCNNVGRNTMVFFPSFRVLNNLYQMGLESKISNPVFREEQGMSQQRLMAMVNKFKDHRGAVMLTVMGGRVSEGLDFPDEELQLAIIAGIPYPTPTLFQQRLRELYDKRFGRGKGWEYAADAPALRKMMQSIGRLIRRQEDVGAAVILDSRIVNFRGQIDMRSSKDPAQDVVDFFASHGLIR